LEHITQDDHDAFIVFVKPDGRLAQAALAECKEAGDDLLGLGFDGVQGAALFGDELVDALGATRPESVRLLSAS
jgi:hypothetical protein